MNQFPSAVARDRFGIVLGYQVPIGPYVVDFTFTHERVEPRFVIELDGHAWHRRTAEEAGYEAHREREISAEGWTIIRYMGAEVMRDPRKVAQNAFGRVFAKLPRPGLAKAKPQDELPIRATRQRA